MGIFANKALMIMMAGMCTLVMSIGGVFVGLGAQFRSDASNIFNDLRFTKIVGSNAYQNDTHEAHVVALASDGRLFGWGFAQGLGLNLGAGILYVTSPVPMGGELRFRDVAVGHGATIGVTTDGELVMFSGGGGIGSTFSSDEINFATVSLSGGHIIALDDEGRLFRILTAWLNGVQGGELVWHAEQLATEERFRYIHVGLSVRFAITNDGRLFAWGRDQAGIIYSTSWDWIEVSHPNPIHIRTGHRFTQISTRGDPGVGVDEVAMALTEAGHIVTWGGFFWSGGTDNFTRRHQNSVFEFASIATSWVSNQVALALDPDGRLIQLGGNGQVETHIGGTTRFTQIAQASDGVWQTTSFAIGTCGRIFSWGMDLHGTLGLGISRGSPFDGVRRVEPEPIMASEWIILDYMVNNLQKESGLLQDEIRILEARIRELLAMTGKTEDELADLLERLEDYFHLTQEKNAVQVLLDEANARILYMESRETTELNRAGNMDIIGYIMIALGIVTLISGIVLMLVASKKKPAVAKKTSAKTSAKGKTPRK